MWLPRNGAPSTTYESTGCRRRFSASRADGWHDRATALALPTRAAFAENKKWTAALDGVLGEISKTGHSQFEWAQLKPVLAAKIEVVIRIKNAISS